MKKGTQQKPKAILIEDEKKDGQTIYRLYRLWKNGKTSKEPFYITDSLEDMTFKVQEKYKEWGIKPTRDFIQKIKGYINNQK